MRIYTRQVIWSSKKKARSDKNRPHYVLWLPENAENGTWEERIEIHYEN
jgi:hypothetical protein